MNAAAIDLRAQLAVRLVQSAGLIVREHYQRAGTVEHKGAIDLVTDADRAAEAHVVSEIRRMFPEDGLQAEEGSTNTGSSGYRWVIDPLDGTTNFAHRIPHFAVSIGVAFGADMVAGAILDPVRAELFHTVRGRGAFLGPRRIHVSPIDELMRAVLATGFAYDRATTADTNHREFEHFNMRCQGVRRMGAAALDLAYVAAGRVDGFWELKLQPWDVAAGALLVQEAGGRVTRYDGSAYDYSGRDTVATNGVLHDLLVETLRTLRGQTPSLVT